MSGDNADKRRLNRIEVITSVAAVVVLYVILESFGVTCPIKYITGISCAGCGMSRAWISLLHFNIHDAFMYHPLFFLPPVVVIVMLLKSKINIKSRHRRKNFQSEAPQNRLFPPESPPSYPQTGVHDGYPRLFQRTAAPPHDRKRPLIPGTPRAFRLFQASPPYGSPDPDRRRALQWSDTDTGGSASSSAKTVRQPPAC